MADMAGAGATELETLVVKLMADASQYQATLAKAEADVTATVAHVEAETARLAAAAKRVIDATATPAQKYARELQTLDELLAKDMISQEQYNRAVKQAADILPATAAAQRKLNEELKAAAQVTRAMMTEEEKFAAKTRELYRMFREGDITFQTYMRAMDQAPAKLKALAQAEDLAKQAAAARNAVMQQGVQITQQYMTQAQQKAAAIANVQGLLAAGAITQQTYTQALAGINHQFSLLGPKLMGVSTVLNQFHTLINRVGMSLTAGITAPVVALATTGVHEFARFDDAMNRTFAVAGNVSAGLRAQMKATATEISNSSITPATNLAKAYYTLVQAGLSAAQAQEALRIVNKFAVAGNIELMHATESLINVQKVMGLGSEDAVQNAKNLERVANVVLKASLMTQASAEDFARSISTKVGAKARQLGKDIEEVTAALAAYAVQGTKAELAGEQGYIVLRDLERAALKNAENWKTLGMAVYDEGGRMRDVSDIVEDLTILISGLSNKQQKQIMMMLGFQDRSSAATNTLIGMAEAMHQFDAELRHAGGEIDRVGGIIESSFLSQIKQTWNQLTNLSRQVGEILAPYIATLNEYIRQGIAYWNSLSPAVKEMAVWLALVAATAGPVVLALGAMVGATAGVVAIIGGLVVLGPEVLAFIGAIVGTAAAFVVWAAAIVEAVAQVVYALYDPDGFASFTARIVEWVGTGLRIATRLFMAFSGWLGGPFLGIVYDGVKHALESVFKLLVHGTVYVMDHILDIISGKASIADFLKTLGKDFEAGFADRNFLNTATNILKEELGSKFNDAGKAAAEAFVAGANEEDVNPAVAGAAEAASAAVGAAGGPAGAPTRDMSGTIDAMSKEAKDAREEIDKLIAKHKMLASTVGMSASEILVWRLEQAHATEDVIKAAKADAELIDEWERMEKVTKAAEKEAERMARKAESLAEKHRSPLEKIVSEQLEVKELFDKGMISVEAYAAEIARLDEELKVLDGKHEVKLSFKGLESVEVGTAEAMNRVDEYLAKMGALGDASITEARPSGKRNTRKAAARDKADIKAIEAASPPTGKAAEDAGLITALDTLVDAIELNTEARDTTATIELVPSGIDGGGF